MALQDLLSWRARCIAASLVASTASAQTGTGDAPGRAAESASANATPPANLPSLTISAESPTARASVGGFGDTPLSRSPLRATVVTESDIRNSGGTGLSSLTRFDASVSDAYNSEGYWSFFAIRGFTLDNRFNYRRDGLPINAETSLPLENKSTIEVLKGTSGIQAGTSSPGGLVNLVVKRPEGSFRSASLGWREGGTLGTSADLSQRFGEGERFGLRANVAYEDLEPQTRRLDGHRRLVALAADWRVSAGTLLEAELEHSMQSQPSLPGLSMLGNEVPDADDFDPRINLNNQPWTTPIRFDATTASLRWQQRLDDSWRFQAHLGVQRLKTDDRIAFPFGCSAEEAFDRYCSDGTFDLYDWRSENERRDTTALDLSLRGRFATGAARHQLTGGVLASRFRARFEPNAFNPTFFPDGTPGGTGNVDGSGVVLPNPERVFEGTNRNERSTEWYLRDAIEWTDRWSTWLGVRHTRIRRDSELTNGDADAGYTQSFTTPWVALTYRLDEETTAYASWGKGVESEVAPNLPNFANAGQPLPSLKSRQWEVGLKNAGASMDWSVALFAIKRPRFGDLAAPDDQVTRQVDGEARHRGVEADVRWKAGSVTLTGSAMLLDAELRGTEDGALDGNRPVNVPRRSLRLGARHDPAALAGWSFIGNLTYEGDRMVLPDNGARIPSWTRLDAAALYRQRVGATSLTWLVGVDNVADKRAWKESPFLFAHAWLYPLPPRTWRLSLQADL